MSDRFEMDFGASSISSVKKAAEEAARFGGISPMAGVDEVSASESRTAAAAAPALLAKGASLEDALAHLIESDAAQGLSLVGCERLDTHIKSDVKRRLKVFCAMHGLNLRQVSELAFEALVAAMDEYESRSAC